MDWTSAQLRSLVELTRRGTITAVAEALGYTPGGVSQQITALEKATGRQLLRRVGRRVELTDAGATLALHAQRILTTEAEAVEALERTRNEISGTLRVGLFATAAAEILPPALRRVRETHPGVTVRSRDMDVDEVYDAVAGGSVDLALGLDYPDVPIPRDPSLRVRELSRERFSLAVPTGTMPGRSGGSGRSGQSGPLKVSLADTRDLGWILPSVGSYYGRAVLTACRRAGFEPQVLHEVTDTAATLALVEAGVGVSVVTDLMLRLRPSCLDVLELHETMERHIVVVCRSFAEHRPTVAALVDVLRTSAGRRPPGDRRQSGDTLLTR
ncbi:LysR substrate-binding domain-containing protein [Streptomyces rugosispiralis]|uniref:LysR substrate-binding domain-containing protein n=1 Tax=Streptomyces rugosispiralis TaxID=2967341 RepID=A0ABT1UR10_9ACTN|nr:LysR substrate-binding domain-containing protein [Streptomyces rugosispiralis]MCQ8187553.1 LysR substrate-binding domain-containing protein [Streptomyces rugosispiralis]